MSRNLGALTFLDHSGPAWPVMGVLYLYLYLFSYRLIFNNIPGQRKKLCNGFKHVKLKDVTCTKNRIENVVSGSEP
jgi:hypothetical protein